MKKLLFAASCIGLGACQPVGVAPVAEPVIVMDVQASRAFAGPGDFPPSGFAGYGILAFPVSPRLSPDRFTMFCQAYALTFLTSSSLAERGVPIDEQMVTVLPVSSSDVASQSDSLNEVDACNLALGQYDVAQAQSAIAKAEAASDRTDGVDVLDGRGPFLLAWSPGGTFGSRDALVLVADLSNTSSKEQAELDMRTWQRDIEQDPSIWRRGWNVEGVSLLAQRWVDRRGAAIVKLIGGWE